MSIDLSLYYVTALEMIPPGVTLERHFREVLSNGVTVVQLREKEAETGDFVAKAREVKALCDEFNVPLIINDRVDVALAVDAAGVHVGMDDMALETVRQLLPANKVVGVSVRDFSEIPRALGADYIGVGTVYATLTKKVKKPPLGPVGASEILVEAHRQGFKGDSVIIGGLNASNVYRTLASSRMLYDGKIIGFDGVAIVSAIAATRSPGTTCRLLSKSVSSAKKLNLSLHQDFKALSGHRQLVDDILKTIDAVKAQSPVIHQITNYVVINDNANVTIALGGSPIMSSELAEMEEFAAFSGAFVYNMGNILDSNLKAALVASKENKKLGHPCILDPVGVGASKFRSDTCHQLIETGNFSIIKGNAAEISYIAGNAFSGKGVDAGDSVIANPEKLVKDLASKTGTVVVMTGATDYVSDGKSTYAISAGSPMMANITGSGCSTSSAVATFSACAPNNLVGAITGLLAVNLAGERANQAGPGSFRASWIDEMFKLSAADIEDMLLTRAGVLYSL